jgi:uncharacterized protein YndB with AHSA1/START domain
MPTFRLQERPADWVPQAPITVRRSLPIAATPDEVWDVLADLGGWSEWCGGMKRVRIDGAATGVGALRTVWVAGSRVQERFLVWEPGQRMTFVLLSSTLPGLAAMVEDWALSPDPGAGGGTRLDITLGIEAAGFLRHFPGVVRWVLARSTRGAAGITARFQ